MIGIIDYGMGNILSVQNAVEYLGEEAIVLSSPELIDQCDRLILPGVGAFSDCMVNLEDIAILSLYWLDCSLQPESLCGQ